MTVINKEITIFREPLDGFRVGPLSWSNWNLEMLVFAEGGKENLEINPWCQVRTNNKPNPHKLWHQGRIKPRPLGGRRMFSPLHHSCSTESNPDHLVGDRCSHHCTIPALQNQTQTTWWKTGALTTAPFLLCRIKPRPFDGRRVLAPLHHSCSAESNPDHLVGDGCSHHCTITALQNQTQTT